jgi:hypothetical protein
MGVDEMGKAQGITGLAISPPRRGAKAGKDRGRVACGHLESIDGFSANGNYIAPVPATKLEVGDYQPKCQAVLGTGAGVAFFLLLGRHVAASTRCTSSPARSGSR